MSAIKSPETAVPIEAAVDAKALRSTTGISQDEEKRIAALRPVLQAEGSRIEGLIVGSRPRAVDAE